MTKKMELNRKKFINEILNVDFNGETNKCAKALGINEKYFNQMIMDPTKKGGTKLLGGVYSYCKKTDRNPEDYIFI